MQIRRVHHQTLPLHTSTHTCNIRQPSSYDTVRLPVLDTHDIIGEAVDAAPVADAPLDLKRGADGTPMMRP